MRELIFVEIRIFVSTNIKNKFDRPKIIKKCNCIYRIPTIIHRKYRLKINKRHMKTK